MNPTSVDNGSRAMLDAPFYKGEVGVVDRDGRLEIAWFGRDPRRIRFPVEAMLDGRSIVATGLVSRPASYAAAAYGIADAKAQFLTARWGDA